MPILSVLVLAIAAAVFQYAVIDPYIVPEISKVWQEIEANGTALDADLKTVRAACIAR